MSLPTPPSPCPFVAGPMVTDLRAFVGRKEELQAITMHMTGIQPTSINIVGERRIGKSSLIYHFFQTWELGVKDTGNYAVIYLSLQRANCRNRNGFYQSIAQELSHHPLVQRKASLALALTKSATDDSAFADMVREWKQYDVLPVLCLDEFEVLLKYRDEFNDGFYDHLRSLMDENSLMLVLTSHEPIDIYRYQYKLTSNFFNLGHVKFLKELTEVEAIDLSRLPASTTPGTLPALSLDDQKLVLQWGGKHPYLLQLAASFLCQARQKGENTNWANRQFEAEKLRLYEPASQTLYWWAPLRWLAWTVPIRLGRISIFVGKNADDIKAWITGIVVIVLVVLILLGLLSTTPLLSWIKMIGG